MVLERILLQTIKFDLQVEHPYQFLLRYAKQLKGICLKFNFEFKKSIQVVVFYIVLLCDVVHWMV